MILSVRTIQDILNFSQIILIGNNQKTFKGTDCFHQSLWMRESELLE